MTVAWILKFWYNWEQREWITMIETNRLTIMKIRECDREACLDLLTNGIVKQTYMLPDFEKREDAILLFRRLMDLSNGTARYLRGIYLQDHLIGYLNEVEKEGNSMEVGYLIHPDYHNKGYMTEALVAFIEDLFSLGLEEIIAGAFEGNHASERVMIKSGMKKLDRYDSVEYRNETHPCFYYHITRKME